MSTAEPANNHGAIAAAVARYKAEGRWLTVARLLVVAACLNWFGLLVWALPSLAGVTSVGGDAAVGLAAVFCLAAAGFSIASLAVWRPILKNEPGTEFLHIVTGSRKSIRTQSQFERRLAYECGHANGAGDEGFIVTVVRASKKAHDSRRHTSSVHPSIAALLVRSAAREDDVVAVAPPYDVWLLARSDADALRQSVIPRLARELKQPEAGTSCQLGIAVFGEDGTTPASLLDVARSRLADMENLPAAERAA